MSLRKHRLTTRPRKPLRRGIREVQQNNIEKWSKQDEEQLKKLIAKRLATSSGDYSHDIKFVSDLFDGEEGESIVADALKKAEIKRDYKAGTTKNIFVEIKQSNRNSGLSTTEADFWIFLLSDEEYSNEVFIGIKKDRLKHIVDKIKWEVNGGDNNASKGKLVKLSQLLHTNTKLGRHKYDDVVPF